MVSQVLLDRKIRVIKPLNPDNHLRLWYDDEIVQKKLLNPAYNERHQRTKKCISTSRKGIDIQIISECTGLSIEKIENLNEIENKYGVDE